MLAACARPVTDIPQAGYSPLKAEIRHETGDILEKHVAAQRRLLNVGGPMLMRNADLCPRRLTSPGFVVHSDFDLPDALRDVAAERLNLGRDARVLAVFTGSAAWDAGIRPGDILVSMDERGIRNAADARARLRRLNVDRITSARFGFIREGRSFAATLPFVPICNYPLNYMTADRIINAYADGRAIYVTQGMMDFADDSELAAIIGHELAHNIMHHSDKHMVNTVPITVAGIIIDGMGRTIGMDPGATQTFNDLYTHIWSEKFEKEADYVGLYLLARAGGDMGAAPRLWRRMAAEHGITGVELPAGAVRTHPDSPERFVVLTQARKEIDNKIRKGEALMPNLSTGFPFGRKYWPWENPHDADDEPDDRDLNH